LIANLAFICYHETPSIDIGSCGRLMLDWSRSRLVAQLGLMGALFLGTPPALADSDPEALAARASEALHRAVAFYREQVAVHGSYVWKYSVDLTVRKGEGEASPSQGWVQPPGTPAIGLAYLAAWEATGDGYILDAALETARALVATQLVSGGWHHWIEFDPEARLAWCYRQPPSGCSAPAAAGAAPAQDAAAPSGDAGRLTFDDNDLRDASTLDDAITQSALTLLLRVDAALGGSDPAIREAIEYGLAKLIAAQYPNGAWPVRFDLKVPDELTASAWRARYPESWPREFVGPADPEFYSLNDHLIREAVRVLLLADRELGNPAYRASAARAGEFLLAAQMPAPQPAWAQLYDRRLVPIWGRAFEPPALASWESGSSIEALLALYLALGDPRYLDAAGSAVAWLERVRLPDGEWARFYELRSDRPLYMTQDYQLTYEDDDLPTHYGFKGTFGLPEVMATYHSVARQGREGFLAAAARPPDRKRIAASLSGEVEKLIAALEPNGRWIDREMIRSEDFIDHVTTLARYVGAVRGQLPSRTDLLP
jgi:hypothetical protein